tara:strand:- start:376 stop:774 length:399 start_codon:yes stop_codon:yes gene_type:complete
LSDKDNVPKKRGRGRPRKTEVEAKKKRNRVGRPAGEASRIKEFHARLLATSGETVINTIITKALDNDDKDQVACLKMCIDRVLPMSYFDKGKDAGRGSVNIQISMVGDKKAEVLEQEEVTDVEFETVTKENT